MEVLVREDAGQLLKKGGQESIGAVNCGVNGSIVPVEGTRAVAFREEVSLPLAPGLSVA